MARKRGAQKGHQCFKRILPTRADRTIKVPRKRVCRRHKGERLRATGEIAEAFQIDLRSTRKGYKKVINKYTGSRVACEVPT